MCFPASSVAVYITKDIYIPVFFFLFVFLSFSRMFQDFIFIPSEMKLCHVPSVGFFLSVVLDTEKTILSGTLCPSSLGYFISVIISPLQLLHSLSGAPFYLASEPSRNDFLIFSPFLFSISYLSGLFSEKSVFHFC